MSSLYGVGTYSKGNYSAPDYVNIAVRPTFANVGWANAPLTVVQVVDLVPVRFLVNTHLTGLLRTTDVYFQGQLQPSISMTGRLTPYANLSGSLTIRTWNLVSDLGKEEYLNLGAFARISVTFGSPILINAGWKPQPPCPGDWDEAQACPPAWGPSAPAPPAFAPVAPSIPPPWVIQARPPSIWVKTNG